MSSDLPLKPPRILIAMAGRVTREVVDELILSLLRERADAELTLLDSREPWSQDASRQWEWITRLQARGFDQAIILGDGRDSPHALAYALYLAGIPLRSGVSAEFGGRTLTRQVHPLGPGRYPASADLVQKEN